MGVSEVQDLTPFLCLMYSFVAVQLLRELAGNKPVNVCMFLCPKIISLFLRSVAFMKGHLSHENISYLRE